MTRPAPAPARVVRWPWRAELTDGATGPGRLLERLVGQTLHHGLPAQRRVGPFITPLARRGWKPGGLARTARLDPGTDHGPLIAALVDAWDGLAAASERLPATPGELSLLVLDRAAGRTSFVLSDDRLVAVHKEDGGEGRVGAETEALLDLAGHPLVPRFLGRVAGGDVQEALEGKAPVLRSFPRKTGASGERWRASLAKAAADAFDSLGRASVHATPTTPTTHAPYVLRAASAAELDEHERDRVRAAREAMLTCPVRVRSHGDPSPQNWLVDRARRVIGLVDFEHTDPHALPGWDVLYSTISWAEHRGGLRRGSEQAVLDTLVAEGGLARDGREAARDAILAVGGSPEWASLAPLALHARRLGEDLEEPGLFASDRSALVEAVRRLARTP